MGTCSFPFVPASEMNGFAALCTLVMMLPQTCSNGANQSCAETSQTENPNKSFYKLAISGIFLLKIFYLFFPHTMHPNHGFSSLPPFLSKQWKTE